MRKHSRLDFQGSDFLTCDTCENSKRGRNEKTSPQSCTYLREASHGFFSSFFLKPSNHSHNLNPCTPRANRPHLPHPLPFPQRRHRRRSHAEHPVGRRDPHPLAEGPAKTAPPRRTENRRGRRAAGRSSRRINIYDDGTHRTTALPSSRNRTQRLRLRHTHTDQQQTLRHMGPAGDGGHRNRKQKKRKPPTPDSRSPPVSYRNRCTGTRDRCGATHVNYAVRRRDAPHTHRDVVVVVAGKRRGCGDTVHSWDGGRVFGADEEERAPEPAGVRERRPSAGRRRSSPAPHSGGDAALPRRQRRASRVAGATLRFYGKSFSAARFLLVKGKAIGGVLDYDHYLNPEVQKNAELPMIFVSRFFCSGKQNLLLLGYAPNLVGVFPDNTPNF